MLLVSARLAHPGEDGPLAVFAVPRDTPGLRQHAYSTVDGAYAGDIWLDQLYLPATAHLGGADADADADAALELVLHIEQARSISYLVAVRCLEPDAASRQRALSAAKVVIGQACRFVGQQAVQLHGGMGVTDELNVSHYFKRLMAIELQCGSTDYRLALFASQGKQA